MPESGKEYYLRHKGDNCHINVKKYLKTPAMVNAFLKQLKKPEAFQKTFRAILRDRPTTKNPMDWMVWKNRLLQHMESVAKIPDDFCEVTGPVELPSKKESSTAPYSMFSALPLPLVSPSPFEPHSTGKIISDDPCDTMACPIGFSVEAYLWKDIFSPVLLHMDSQVADLLESLTTHKELLPHLIECTSDHVKTFLQDGTTTKEDTYVYALAGGFAYRALGTYLRQQYPTLPIIENILVKGQDYDINFMVKGDTIDSFPMIPLFDHVESFCEKINTLYYSTWNKIHKIIKNGVSYDVTFIKPSPCVDRQGLVYSDYRYIHDRFLLSIASYAYNGNVVNITYQITMCIQIKTATDTYCFTDHILDILFYKEDEIYNPPYEIQKEPWFPAINIIHLLSKIIKHKPIHSIPTTQTEGIQRFQIKNHMYQLPNVNALLLQSMNAMVIRIASDDHRTYKARQDYARIYTILRMLETIPEEIILTRKEISYIYTTLQSITTPSNWSSFSDAKKKEMIQQYKEALHSPSMIEELPWKTTRTKAIITDKLTQKTKHITDSYYKGPYEECRVNRKEEDPLLYELGVAKFNLRRMIIDNKVKADLPSVRRKSCDGTASVKRRIQKAHKTRKTKRL
jgi:hypothetical protein